LFSFGLLYLPHPGLLELLLWLLLLELLLQLPLLLLLVPLLLLLVVVVLVLVLVLLLLALCRCALSPVPTKYGVLRLAHFSSLRSQVLRCNALHSAVECTVSCCRSTRRAL